MTAKGELKNEDMEEKMFNIFNLSGLKVGDVTAKAKNVDLGKLPSGINIVDGKNS